MKKLSNLLLLISLKLAAAWGGKHWKRQYTVDIPAGREDCFYLPDVKLGSTIELEFQVTSVSTATGQLDILCRLLAPSPSTAILFQSDGGSEGSHEENVEDEAGDYRLCFSNHMSTWSRKTVWFEVAVKEEMLDTDDYFYDEDDYLDDDDLEIMRQGNEAEAGFFDMAVDEIKSTMQSVRIQIGKMRHFQMMFGASMNADSHHAISNMEKINFWSFCHLCLILLAGFMQVFMIRQLFEDKSVMHRFVSRT